MQHIQVTTAVITLMSFCQVSQAQKPTDNAGSVKVQERSATIIKDACLVHRDKDVIGAPVRNPEGENLGDIKELVINPSTGRIDYAVLSFGGFLGMNDKLFAIPWSVLDSMHEADANKKYYLLSVDKELLKKSPGFPKDNWPDISSPEWSESIMKFYAEDLRRRGSLENSANEAIDDNMRFHLVKASDLKGCDAKTSDGSDAGEISELAIDPTRGRVAYVVLASGGFLGFGTDKYLLPWQACNFSVAKGKDLVCSLTVPKAKFESAPGFKDDDWKSMSDPAFVERVYGYYGYPSYWKSPVDAGSKRTE